MEYSRTFKGEQGVGLEMKVKVECFTEESMREALSLIAQSSHKFYLDTAKVCKGQMASEETGAKEGLENQMEAAKPIQKKPVSDEPDFVWEPDIKCKGDAEDFGAMSQEKFEEMLQHWLESNPRCKFAEGNGGESIEKNSAPECEENQRHPHTILADLPTKIVPILVGNATDILEVSTQSEYIKFAAMLLNEAVRYNNIFSHAKGYDESVSNAAEKIRSNSQGAAV